MPLLDHFHPPLYPARSWESLHSRWANSIADGLNASLPDWFVAEVQLHWGSQVEADVAELDVTVNDGNETSVTSPEYDPITSHGNGGRTVAVAGWAPPQATFVLPAVFPDDLEIHIRDQQDDARLLAVIELVSPRNKDRPQSRRTFAAKSAAYLQQGVGLVIVDVVTGRRFNLHNELIELMHFGSSFVMPRDSTVYAAAYRPIHRAAGNQIDVWTHSLSVGQALPVVPLALRGWGVVRLDLEFSYTDARRRSRLA